MATLPRREDLPLRITKGEQAEHLYSGQTYDIALPQDWLDSLVDTLKLDYVLALSGYVWLYDLSYGRPAPLFAEAYEWLVQYDSLKGTLYHGTKEVLVDV